MRVDLVSAALVSAMVGCQGTPQTAPANTQLRAGWSHVAVGGVDTDTYVPLAAVPAHGRAALIVLHGCVQTAADLKAGVDWDQVAEGFDAVVSLPTVPNGGKYLGCWNYYGGNHSRNTGDAAKLLDLVDALTSRTDLGIDPDRVWIAGLSSGGGMAMVMGCLAPDVFSGVGIAAGPTIGTSAFQIASVATTLSSASATCGGLAGSEAAAFDTQLVSVIAGTSDYTVAQGYAPLNADVFGAIYATGGDPLTAAPLVVSALEGYQPAGTGTVLFDAVGPRVQRIAAQGMGHAWPAGTGPGPESRFIAQAGVDYGWTLAAFFSENARRTAPTSPTTPPEEPEEPTEEPIEEPIEEPTSTEPQGACDPWLEEQQDDINGHLSRYDVYPAGYGAADETYVDLLDANGVFGVFGLYLGTDGEWYADSGSLPPRDCP